MVLKKHSLFIVENNSVPHDQRPWREAQAIRELGYDVSVISPVKDRTSPKFEVINNISIYRHYRPSNANSKIKILIEYANALFWEYFLSFKIFLKKPFHYIHAANPPDHTFLIALFFKLFNVKYIYDHHDLTPEMYHSKYGRSDVFYKILLVIEKINMKIADKVISTNESYKRIAIERNKKNTSDVHVVRNGPDLTLVNHIEPDYSYKGDFEYLVAYIGSVGLQERIDVLLDAIRYIVYKKKMNNTKFVIIGSGSSLKDIVELSKSMNISQYVHFTHYVPFPQFYNILAAADICVNPEFTNKYTNYSTMVKIMDYMVVGKPIVQFETIEGKKTAEDASIYVKNNDEKKFAEAIIELLNAPEKRGAMGQIGKKRINEYLNWEKQKPNLLNVYGDFN